MTGYVNIRDDDLLGPCIGATVVDVTQHDKDEYADRGSFVALHFSNGMTVQFPIGEDGFETSGGGDDGERSDGESR